MAEKYVAELKVGRSVIAIQPSHRENDLLNEEIRRRMRAEGIISGPDHIIQAHRTLGWTKAERENVRNLRPGFVLEITTGKDKGQTFEVRQVDGERSVAYGVNKAGLRIRFDKSNVDTWQACVRRDMPIAIGDTLVTHAAMKTKGKEIINGHTFKVASIDASGAIHSDKGELIETKNLSHGYATTCHKAQSQTFDTVLCGFDRRSLNWINRKISYVSVSRGRTMIKVFTDSREDLVTAEKRTGDRMSAGELVEFYIARILKKRIERKKAINL
jgi:ATP-dependent exoDNAse (exonuclease V) alpha subunit